MDGHAIHRLHEFVPHMARLQPDLMGLLPRRDRPAPGIDLSHWVLSLPQKRLIEITSVWVLESLSRLRNQSPLTNVLLRGCLCLEGEFDLTDASAVAIGEPARPGSARREEIRRALNRAARSGVLIHLPSMDRYCIPFPVRLSFEGVEFLEPLEREAIRWRIVDHFSCLAALEPAGSEMGQVRHWRFGNLFFAFQTAVELMEELLGVENGEWVEHWRQIREIPREVAGPIAAFTRLLGKAIVVRQSDTGERLLAAGCVAAAQLRDREARGEFLSFLGQYYLRRGQYGGASSAYRKAEAVWAIARRWRESVVAISAQAIARRDAGHHDAAVDQFLRASHLAAARGLGAERLDNANCAARLLLEMDAPARAAEILTPVVEGEGDVTYPPRAESLLLLGIALLRCGHLDAARPRLFDALGEARTLLHRPAEAEGCLQVAHLFDALGERTQAARWAERARNLFAEISGNEGLALCCLLLNRLGGTPAGGDGNGLLRRALRHAQAAKSPETEADVWRAMREADTDTGNGSEVFLRCRELEALRSTRRHHRLARGHMELALVYLQKRAHLAAGTDILRAQAITRALGLHELQGPVEEAVERVLPTLSEDELVYLTEEVTEELESGKLFRRPDEWQDKEI